MRQHRYGLSGNSPFVNAPGGAVRMVSLPARSHQRKRPQTAILQSVV